MTSTTEQYSGTHRPEVASGPAPTFTERPQTRGVINRTAGEINARAWRMAADGIRADMAARAALRQITG